MEPRLRVRNWTKFQHYKDRNPPWIKLYHDLLDNYDFHSLDGTSAKHLVMLWLISSEEDGNLPDLRTIAFRLRVSEEEAQHSLDKLHRWLESGVNEAPQKWPSRYISDALREQVMKRDGYACVFCVAKENLEVDHIVPVSAMGESLLENLQVLCRSCNRTKRTRVANAKKSVAVATQEFILRSPETETETETERESETETERTPKFKTIPPTSLGTPLFMEFWNQYPRKVGRLEALKVWVKGLFDEHSGAILAGLELWKRTDQWQDAQFIPYPATWLANRRWKDAPVAKIKKETAYDIARRIEREAGLQ